MNAALMEAFEAREPGFAKDLEVAIDAAAVETRARAY